MKKAYSVIGLGFGDEGKGNVVDYLCSQHDPKHTLVIRHSGGHQVGHTVRIDDIIHEFRHFGSGTLREVPTYWDKQCTVSPIMFTWEHDILRMKGIFPKLLVNTMCPVTTPLDIAYNRYYNNVILGAKQSVGVGFSSTLIRHETVPLYVKDLKYPKILEQKLKSIMDYYVKLTNNVEAVFAIQKEANNIAELGNFSFEECCEYFLDNTILTNSDPLVLKNIIIFEGNQGVLLDKHHGFLPYVTHGKTTNYNLRNFDVQDVERWYATRAYSTRHGDGPMLSTGYNLNLINMDDESNHQNNHQGEFRTAPLNLDLIKYALESDHLDSSFSDGKPNIVISCIDQFEDAKQIPYLENDVLQIGNLSDRIYERFNTQLYINTSSKSQTIDLYKK